MQTIMKIPGSTRTSLCAIAGFLIIASHAVAQPFPDPPRTERLLIAEAFRLSDALRDTVWSGWSAAPFPVLLVTDEAEYLIGLSPPSSGSFAPLGYDSILEDSVFARSPQYSPSLRATFPAVGGTPTVVVGPPDATESPARWVLTLLHEHFHQWQMTHPRYFQAVDSLGLAGDDTSGQWMLNYPFPYDSPAVQRRFQALTESLADALEDDTTGRETLEKYLDARNRFTGALSRDDHRYFSFQVWQEGVARFVEYRLAHVAARQYQPSDEFAKQAGANAFAEAERTLREEIFAGLRETSLPNDRRVAFYPVGAAEALLLDRVRPSWREVYWTDMFSLSPDIEPATD